MPTLLVVDDSEMNIDMLSKWLHKKGFNTLIAKDGKEGIEVATTQQPDLILMDLSMPVIDGWEASKRLKNQPETKHIPIIALSAHALEEERISALEAGCDDYETKPLNLKGLTEKILQHLTSPSQ